MSLAIQFASAIELAPFSDLTGLAQKLWKAYAAGHLDDGTAQELAERIEARKPKQTGPENFRAAVPKRQRQRSPDKTASIERRRQLARASPVPPELVGEFTTCEHAVITVIVGEIQKHGVCSLFMDAIAALAGTCRTVVRNAQRKAKALGLLQREERRRRGQKSLSNLVRIVSPSWRRWLAWIGRRKTSTTKDQVSKNVERHPVEVTQCGLLAGSGLRGGP